MKKFFTSTFAAVCLLTILPNKNIYAQNVGIGTATPLEKLHVIGNIRSSTLAGVGNRVVLADPNGTLVVASGATSPAWMTTGNSGTVATTNFIGTTDAIDFVVKTGGSAATNERIRVFGTGPVSINAATTQAGDVLGVYGTGYAGTINAANNFAINGYVNVVGGAGVYGENPQGLGVFGNSGSSVGILGQSVGAAGFGVQAYNGNITGTGLIASGNNLGGTYLLAGSAGAFRAIRFGVLAFSAVGPGVSGSAVLGTNSKTIIISFFGGAGVTGVDSSSAGSGVIGASYSAAGEGVLARGFGTNGTGILAIADLGVNPYAMWGVIPAGTITGNNSLAIFGDNQSTGTNAVGILGQELAAPNGPTRYAIFSNGDMAASGTKPFVIDHPLDPANKFLKHFSIESNEVLNIYRGNITLDANGEATVQLPTYFESVNNTNYAYNLTAIGQQGNLFIKQEISNKQFIIAGGGPGMKVSWMITAERNDPYLQQNPQARDVEIAKTGDASGKYLLPYLYGQPAESAIYYKPMKNTAPSASPSAETKEIPSKKK